MGTTLPDSKENVNRAKNGVTRRNMLRTGLWTTLMGILGSQTVLAQDNAVAVVTSPQNVPGRALETVAPQSWFAKAIAWLQTEIAALQDEFKKWNIDSKKMEELLAKLLLNEKGLTIEVQKTLDIIFDKLGKTYKFLPEGDKRKAEIKNVWDTIIRIKSELLEWDNLIKAIRFICGLCWNEKFRGETSTINKSYFKWIIDFFDTTTWGVIDGIAKYETSFQAMPSQEIKDLKEKLIRMKNPVSTDDLEPKKGGVDIPMKTVKEGGKININSTFPGIAHWEITIEEERLKMKFNQAWDCPAAKTESIIIPKNTRKLQIKIDVIQKISNGELAPFYIIFQDEKWMSLWSGILSKKNRDTIDVPKWAISCKLDVGVLRWKTTWEATLSWLNIIFK